MAYMTKQCIDLVQLTSQLRTNLESAILSVNVRVERMQGIYGAGGAAALLDAPTDFVRAVDSISIDSLWTPTGKIVGLQR